MRFFPLLLLLAAFSACVNPPEFPDEPVITYVGLSKNQIYQNTNGPRDSIIIHFTFTDGDGDLSKIGADTLSDLFIQDSRLAGLTTPFTLPVFDNEGTGNGISGDIFLTIDNQAQAVCCIANNRFCAENPAVPVDTFSYSIQIADRAGNLSNVIRTEPISILCLGQ